MMVLNFPPAFRKKISFMQLYMQYCYLSMVMIHLVENGC